MHAIFRRLLPALLFLPLAAHGTIVTTATDEDNGSLGGGTGISLREAVKYSPAGDIITFDAALSGQTIRLTAGQITINQRLTIDGSALAKPVTLSGDKTGNGRTSDDTRILQINDVAVTLDSLIISGGAGFSDANVGGAVYAIGHAVNLTVNRCTFSGNRFISDGAAIYFYGAYKDPGTKLTVRNSTFTENTATGYGGAIFAFGTVEIENTTITGNKGFGGGGIAINFNTIAQIQHATITGNNATSRGGCIYNSGTLTLRNSIIAGNTAPVSAGIDGSYVGESNVDSMIPRLAPLGDYGGPTRTMPLLTGSAAINGGAAKANPLFPPLASDQRGFSRVGTPDIGAVEYQGNSDLSRFWKQDFDGDGSPFGVEQGLGTDPLVSDSINSRNLSSPDFDASGHAFLSFGLASAPVSGTRWILKRSPDLRPGSFTEIYRYDGSVDSAAPGFGFSRTVSSVTVTDESPFIGGGFYRFEASLEP